MDGITAMARSRGYDPMALPDTFTVFSYANEDVRAFLHPHWHNFKAIHPMWYFFLGCLYFCIGKIMFALETQFQFQPSQQVA